MNDKKKNDGFDLLSREDLDNVTGGIPYEKPCLISFTIDGGTCANGSNCDTGQVGIDTCKIGRGCNPTGSWTDPER
jgi:hypothetical protein